GNGGWEPQTTIELWHTSGVNVEIFNNVFNNNVSLAGENVTGNYVHVHNNYFTSSTGYACEASMANIEFDHNYVAAGSYPIADFGTGALGTLNVHHNIFHTGTPYSAANISAAWS